jgi:two-component system response regulator HydG
MLSRARVLIVGDDARATNRMRGALSTLYTCEVASFAETGLAVFGSDPFDIVVANDTSDCRSGLELLDTVHKQSPETAFILVGEVGESGSVASAVEAGKRGAYDYIVGPIDERAVVGRVERAAADLERRRLAAEQAVRHAAEPTIIGTSDALAHALDAVDRVAHATAPVLLVGESGTGKDAFAQRIHARSPRRHRPYVVINASAIPTTLLDGELFGHAAGALSGSTRARRGLIAEADGGTVYIDEIADIPIEAQGRLLHVIETGRIRPVGADQEQPIDVRFICATHRELSVAVRERGFREDLYFRLSVLAIELPSLRDRRDDLPSLIDHFLERARQRNPRSPVETLAPAAYQRLLAAEWPGNIRELSGIIERLVILGKSARIEARDLDVLRAASPRVAPAAAAAGKLASLRDVTTRHVETVLASTGGDKPRAAAILGVDVSTLYRWQRKPAER